MHSPYDTSSRVVGTPTLPVPQPASILSIVFPVGHRTQKEWRLDGSSLGDKISVHTEIVTNHQDNDLAGSKRTRDKQKRVWSGANQSARLRQWVKWLAAECSASSSYSMLSNVQGRGRKTRDKVSKTMDQ